MNETKPYIAPRTAWRTPSMSEARIEEMKLLLLQIAGNISCYAGGAVYAQRLRGLVDEIEITPMP